MFYAKIEVIVFSKCFSLLTNKIFKFM